MQDETTDSPESADEGAPTSAAEGTSREPVDASALAEEAKGEIRQAAEKQTERHDAQRGRTSTSTPTKYEADAVTVSRTPSRAAERALEEALESGAQESGADEDMSDYPTAKEVAEKELQSGSGDDAGA